MQFQVPQFIETEDKIVGPLSLRQFFYIAAAGGLTFLLFFTVQTWLWITLSIPVIMIGIAFAFIKVGGRDLATIVGAAFTFYWNPQRYIWHQENPSLKKSASALESLFGGSAMLGAIVSGMTLKHVREGVETGTKLPLHSSLLPGTERYEILERASGERKAARRIDYR